MKSIQAKSRLLTEYLELLVLQQIGGDTSLRTKVKVITPADPDKRGAMLSIAFSGLQISKVIDQLQKRAVMVNINNK